MSRYKGFLDEVERVVRIAHDAERKAIKGTSMPPDDFGKGGFASGKTRWARPVLEDFPSIENMKRPFHSHTQHKKAKESDAELECLYVAVSFQEKLRI